MRRRAKWALVCAVLAATGFAGLFGRDRKFALESHHDRGRFHARENPSLAILSDAVSIWNLCNFSLLEFFTVKYFFGSAISSHRIVLIRCIRT